jgi:hypothetical protein
MRRLIPIGGRFARIGLAFATLVSIAATAVPAEAKDWNHRHHRHRHHHQHFFFQFGTPGCFLRHGYYYCPDPRYYYPPAYYPPPAYYAPRPSFRFVVPFGRRD